MKKQYICLNCPNDKGIPGKKFWASEPVCSCGVDMRLPEYRNFIAPVACIHFVPPHPVIRNRGTGHRRCDGVSIRTHPKTQELATGSPEVVNCPACRAHKDFPAADGEVSVPPEADFAI